MKRLILLTLACTLALAGSAQAHELAAGRALLHLGGLARAADAQAPCPAGVPVQTITVVNGANVRPATLVKVENAVVAQSMQLRIAWSTPCVEFGAGGWPVYLQTMGWNVHCAPNGINIAPCTEDLPTPYAFVTPEWDQANPWTGDFSHEVLEMLVDPGGQGNEVCDPAGYLYLVRSVWVQDFVTPAWYVSSSRGPFDELRLMHRSGQIIGSDT
jgi:hypothetical protein